MRVPLRVRERCVTRSYRSLRLRLRRCVGWVRTCVSAIELVGAVLSSHPIDVWIGDSHAVCFNRRPSPARLSRGQDGQFIWHLGPRIMYSIAKNGFPRVLSQAAVLVGRMSRTSRIVPVLCLGEIDVRCHLVPRLEQPACFDFVEAYVRHGCTLAQQLGASRVVFVVPPPPSAECPEIDEFPIRGTIHERIAAFTKLRSALSKAVAAHNNGPTALLLDVTEELSTKNGEMRSGLSIDGVHTDIRGGQIVRRKLRELELASAT